ncbi:MAG: hypothetical protein M0C28_41740 [Candidatus Moduliflexus flocculans]|nr:hypothetical protein [Candidatus Moduliflexus flocculans]
MVPELELGIAVLTNQESSDAYNSLIYAVVDQAMGAAADRLDGRLPQGRGAGAGLGGRGAEEGGGEARRLAQALAAARRLRPDLRGRLVRPDRRHARGRGRGRQLVMSFAKIAGHGRRHGALEPGDVRRAGGATGSCGPTPTSRSSLDPDGDDRRGPDEGRLAGDTDFSYDFQDLLLKPVKK